MANIVGHDADFTAFVSTHRAALLRLAYLLCGDWGRAEDATQTSLIKLYLTWRRVNSNPMGYASTILVRVVVDEHRRAWRREISGLATASVVFGASDPAPMAQPPSAVTTGVIWIVWRPGAQRPARPNLQTSSQQ